MSSEDREVEEDLRKAAADGDEETLVSMIRNGVNVNSQNSTNGWTALHWGCKRGHQNIVTVLLKAGADPTLTSANKETCSDVATSPVIKKLLGVDSSEPAPNVSNDLPIVPNYIRHPVFPYSNNSTQAAQEPVTVTPSIPISGNFTLQTVSELVLKVRVANAAEKDFIEIDLPRNSLTYDSLVTLMCSELEVNKTQVQKVRKLPDTIIRRDKDVQRLREYQELELILAAASHQVVPEKASFQNYKASVAPKHCDVFY